MYQGFTGRVATGNAKDNIEYGTNIVGGVTPGKEGEHLGLPLLPDLKKAKEQLKPDATAVFVAAHQCGKAIEDAIEAEIPLIVSVAEHNTNLIKRNVLRFPLTVDESLLGKAISQSKDDQGKAVVKVDIDNTTFNLADRIKEKALNIGKNFVISENEKFYLRDFCNPKHILGIKETNDGNFIKTAYSLSGNILGSITDVENEDNTFSRMYSNRTIKIKNDNLISSNEKIHLFPLIRENVLHKTNIPEFMQNRDIGTIDFETYQDLDKQVSIVYSCGLKTSWDNEPILFYSDKNIMDSNGLVIKLLKEMLRPKYSKTKFFCHNLGGFEAHYILRALSLYNLNPDHENKFIIEPIFRDNSILKITISMMIDKKMRKTSVVDSYPLLSMKLRDLTLKFEVDSVKGYFPYAFANKNNLFYVGNTPDKKYYGRIEDSVYNKLVKPEWNFKKESDAYLKSDLNGLYEVIKLTNKEMFNMFKVQLTDSLTISALSLQIYMKSFYNNAVIPLINNKSIYNDIKQAYYGGITEVYKPYGQNLYYYDVNSLYPFVALQSMPGLDCVKHVYYDSSVNIDNLFGFFYCNIVSPENIYLGLLPVRTKNGIEFPKGSWSGWYFSEELKFARENGYEITVLSGYSFSKQEGVFADYVKYIYNIKCSAEDTVKRTLAKSLLNNLLGRFGLDINKPKTEIVDDKKFQEISTSSLIKAESKIGDNMTLVSYIADVNKDVCESFGIDYIKAVDYYKHLKLSGDKDDTYKSISVAISAAVTAYGRIHISNIKLHILKSGYSVYYSDTDSIVTDLELPKDMVSATELGKLKLVHKIKEGYFIGGKTYAFITDQGKEVKKAKGLSSETLDYYNYKELYNGNDYKKGIKFYTESSYDKGVLFKEKEIKLKFNSYNKRTKIFEKGRWVDTRPIYTKQQQKMFSCVSYSKTHRITICKCLIVLFMLLIWTFIFSILLLTFSFLFYDIINHIENPESLNLIFTNQTETNVIKYLFGDGVHIDIRKYMYMTETYSNFYAFQDIKPNMHKSITACIIFKDAKTFDTCIITPSFLDYFADCIKQNNEIISKISNKL